MPPAIIAVGSDDAGLSESENLAAELRKAGVEHRLEVVKDHPHGFLQLEMLPQCLPMIATISSYLKQHAP
jgi:acetyl esterase/lipase